MCGAWYVSGFHQTQVKRRLTLVPVFETWNTMSAYCSSTHLTNGCLVNMEDLSVLSAVQHYSTNQWRNYAKWYNLSYISYTPDASYYKIYKQFNFGKTYIYQL